MFEEVFYLAAQHEQLSKVTRLYAPPSGRWRRCTTRGPSGALRQARAAHASNRRGARPGGAEGGDRALSAVLRPRGVLARRGRPDDQHRAARWRAQPQRRAPDRGEPVAGPGVRGRADALHLLVHPPRRGRDPHVLPRAAPVGSTRPASSSSRSTPRTRCRRSRISRPSSTGTGRCRSTSSTRARG